jgi:hypothetical protein
MGDKSLSHNGGSEESVCGDEYMEAGTNHTIGRSLADFTNDD